MQIIYRLLAVLLVGGMAGGAFAQTRISGKVVDALNNEPVISASISVVNEKTGTLTDLDGNFELEVKELPATLQVNFIGYREQQIDVYDNSEPVVIALNEATDVLQEVVVVGYGTQKRKELTGIHCLNRQRVFETGDHFVRQSAGWSRIRIECLAKFGFAGCIIKSAHTWRQLHYRQE